MVDKWPFAVISSTYLYYISWQAFFYFFPGGLIFFDFRLSRAGFPACVLVDSSVFFMVWSIVLFPVNSLI